LFGSWPYRLRFVHARLACDNPAVTLKIVHRQVFATRGKNSLQAESWETWTKYNSHNQPVLVVMPEGNSIAYEYEDETNTITFAGVPYARRIGLLTSVTRLPGNTLGIPSRPVASIEERGNPINSAGLYFPPQNLGATPGDSDRTRYATLTFFDFQKDATATVTFAGASETIALATTTAKRALSAAISDRRRRS
jgi:hypothetical protein